MTPVLHNMNPPRLNIWEAWECEDRSIAFSTRDGILNQSYADGYKPVRLLHSIQAATPEEAKAIYSLRMAHGAYEPEGEPEECPNGCGAYYYPSGSGQCPYCGPVRRPIKLRDLPGFDSFLANHSFESEHRARIIEVFGDIELIFHPSEIGDNHEAAFKAAFVETLEHLCTNAEQDASPNP